MRDALIEILENQVVTLTTATLALWSRGFPVNASDAQLVLDELAAEGLAVSWPGRKGVTQYATTDGGYNPGGAA